MKIAPISLPEARHFRLRSVHNKSTPSPPAPEQLVVDTQPKKRLAYIHLDILPPLFYFFFFSILVLEVINMSETKSSALRTEIRSALANAGLQDVKDDMMSKCKYSTVQLLVFNR